MRLQSTRFDRRQFLGQLSGRGGILRGGFASASW